MNWQGIVIHHSASPDVSAKEIDQWHKDRGWNGIGYHYVVRKDGEVEEGRSIKKRGAHDRGRNNTHIGICCTGNFNKHGPDRRQITALIRLTNKLIGYHNLKTVERHHENCPGKLFPFDEVLKNTIKRS